MTKVKVKVSKEDVARVGEDRGDFELPKVGLYVLQANSIDPGFSKNSNGDEDQSKPYLQFVYTIVAEMPGEVEPKGNYGNIWDYMSFSPASGWKRAEVLYAFGIITQEEADSFDDDTEIEIDTDELAERKVLGRIKHEKGRTKDDPKRAKIAKLFPYGSEVDAFAASDSTTEYAEEEEPFSAEGGGSSLLTEDDLAAMELKELGDIAKEFDLDPNDFIVKNRAKKLDNDKTKAAVIAAILSAQNGDEGVADEDEESPF